MNKRKNLPVGLQSFREIIEKDYFYVDKTEIIYRLINDYKYIFLSRPRRFGKSLLTNTLREYFAGEKELFKGLAMEHLEMEWTKHPVLHFDLSTCKNLDKDALYEILSAMLKLYEDEYNVSQPFKTLGGRLGHLIEQVHTTTNEKIAVIIDEYDAPLLDIMHKDTEFVDSLRNVMRDFYSPLKSKDEYLRCVFITGITKFSQLSIFSEINNLTNVSMFDKYSAICGITQHELETQLKGYVEDMGEELGISTEDTFNLLKDNYDGYHFTAKSEDLYNPFSLLTSLKNKSILSKWFESGTPTFLIEQINKFKVNINELESVKVTSASFDTSIDKLNSIMPLLYQSGYLTIKKSHGLDIFTLGIPNKEVRIGLVINLLPHYTCISKDKNDNMLIDMYDCLNDNDIDGFFNGIKAFLASIPYTDKHKEIRKSESYYEVLLYLIFTSFSRFVQTQVKSCKGRADVVMRHNDRIYILEIKVDGSAQEALQQINEKGYATPYIAEGKPIIKCGLNICSETCTLEEWVTEKLQ